MVLNAKQPFYRDQNRRLRTFENWPFESSVKKEELVDAGFYYTGTRDLTVCYVCGGGLKGWKPTDDPLAEHAKWFSACALVCQVLDGAGEGLNSRLERIEHRRNMDRNAPAGYQFIMNNRLQIAPPKRPEYIDLDRRMETFIGNWPGNHPKTAEEMAEAGFRYTGPGDNVHCFYCGGGLRRWEPDDDPWLEHARWWPKCGFVLTKRGQEFVDIVQFLKSFGGNITQEMVEQEMVLRMNQRNF